ncbi:MAG: ATPase domain-containing protein [Candidatus Bathyarchaeia archaeon]
MSCRVSSGDRGLDEVLDGGFPRGSLIVLAGNPGTGKTVFSAQFLYRGAVDHNEPGVYVSFAENKETFYGNMMGFGFDFEALEKTGKFRYLDLLTVREAGVSTVLNMIVEAVEAVKAKRLVLDSYSVLAQAFERPFDSRIVAHTLLSKIIRQVGCTSLLISEVPYGSERIGTGMEEFVADGVLLLRASEIDGRLFRDLEIKKMRGTRITESTLAFTIYDGFKAFTMFRDKPLKGGVFQPIPDGTDRFSTGIPDLDSLLGGGYPKGSTVLLEIDLNVSTLQYHLFLASAFNFLAQDRPLFVIPSVGVDLDLILNRARDAGFADEKLERLLRVFEFKGIVLNKHPCLVEMEGRDTEVDIEKYLDTVDEIRTRTGQPVIHVIGVDKMATHYGFEATLRILNLAVSMVRQRRSLAIFILKPGFKNAVPILNSIVDVHLKVVREHGALLVYGLKPRTNLNFVEMDVTKGYPITRLKPIE